MMAMDRKHGLERGQGTDSTQAAAIPGGGTPLPEAQPLPLYYQVAETIKGRILEAHYKSGEPIPPARTLTEEFGVSNITIRKAIQRLTREGLVVPRQGVGTIVAETRWDRVEIKLTGSFRDWFDSASGRLAHLKTKVLAIEPVTPPAHIADLLHHHPDDRFWCMNRQRYYEDRPVSRFVNYFSLPEECQPTRPEVGNRSFIELYQDITGVAFTHFTQQVEAVTADMDLARALDIEFGAALFYVENIYYSAGDAPRAITQMHYRGDSYLYKTKIELSKED